MPNPLVTVVQAEEAVRTVEECLKAGYRPKGVAGGTGAIRAAGDRLKITRSAFQNRINRAKELYSLEPDWTLWHKPHKKLPDLEAAEGVSVTADDVMAALRKAPLTLEGIAEQFGITRGMALDFVDNLKDTGALLHQFDEHYSVEKSQAPAYTKGEMFEYVSRPDNTFLFGACSDQHMGSKYERPDVLSDLYDRYAEAEVDRVFNAGNWVDGVGKQAFNLHDLKIHGLDAQMAHLAENYPHRPGITTYAVSGNCHEGWWAQKEGIDVGKYAENKMKEYGRDDWVDLGFMESYVKLVNANTGKYSILAVVHPGGGSAYALGYSVQKIIEALAGGEKYAVGLFGHYHKLWAGNIRNVWVVSCGTTQDQTTFMRSKVRQEAHVGGALVELEQDPETGAITAMTPKLMRYFNKGYYNNRWSMSGPVNMPKRVG